MPMSGSLTHECPRFDGLQEAASRLPGVTPETTRLFLTLLGTATSVQRAEAALLTTRHLSQGRLIVLLLLQNAGEQGLKSSELAGLAGVSKATITGLLDSLERDAMIERFSDPSDRRSVSARIAPGGHSLIEELMPSYFEWVTRALSSLSLPEQGQLTSLLSKVQRSFQHSSTSLHHE